MDIVKSPAWLEDDDFPFEKLHGPKDFLLWKRRAIAFLKLKHYWVVVEPDFELEDKEMEQYLSIYVWVRLKEMVDESNYPKMFPARTAKAAWANLMESYKDVEENAISTKLIRL